MEGEGGDGEVFGAGEAAAKGDEAGLFEVLGCLLEFAGRAERALFGEVVWAEELG